MPDRIQALPVDPRGYPIPWFVHIDEQGQAEFRIIGKNKRGIAVRDRRCWVCGTKLGRYLAFPIGPMCAINRITSEPPAHRECAVWSAQACPFLSRPNMRRREDGMPEERHVPGEMIPRNPGAVCIWITESFEIVRTETGDLFQVGEPTETLWFAEGRAATRQEVTHSINTGLPLLQASAEKDGTEAVTLLAIMTERAREYLPAGSN